MILSMRVLPPTGFYTCSLIVADGILLPWWLVSECRWSNRASPISVSGIRVGCLRPNERSDRDSLPPTLSSPSVGSRNGDLSIIWRRLCVGSLLMILMPCGHSSCCICSYRATVASFSFGRLSCSLMLSISCFHAVPVLISSVAYLV